LIPGSDKKVKFEDDATTRSSKKSKAATNAAAQIDKLPAAKARESRKRAADFFDDAEAPVQKETEAPVKAKKVKTSTTNGDPAAPVRKEKKTKAIKNAEEVPLSTTKVQTSPAIDDEPALPTSISKPKSQKEANGKKKGKTNSSKALVKATPPEETAFDGFSSDDDVDGNNLADQTEAGIPRDHIPQAKLSKKERKALAAAQNDVPGTIYVG